MYALRILAAWKQQDHKIGEAQGVPNRLNR